MEQPIFFDSLADLARVLITVPVLYLVIIVFVRISGKRTTSQMNNFDWIVTVSLGSLAASGILVKDISIAETVLAMLIFIVLQWILTKASYRFPAFADLIKNEPAVLVRDGVVLHTALQRERVTEAEVRNAIRAAGHTHMAAVGWAIPETDGKVSVIGRPDWDRPEGDPADEGLERNPTILNRKAIQYGR